IQLPVRRPQRHQNRNHNRIPQLAGRREAGLGGVVSGRGYLQHVADGLDPQLVPVGVDERHHHFCGRSSSAAKKAEARFKISLARRNSRFSCSSFLIRAESSDVVPARTPSSISAWFTQLRTDSTPYPNWSATRLTAPCRSPVSARSLRTRRTA